MVMPRVMLNAPIMCYNEKYYFTNFPTKIQICIFNIMDVSRIIHYQEYVHIYRVRFDVISNIHFRSLFINPHMNSFDVAKQK